jgi:DNA-binding beta-propeller fold protein YncE
VFRPGVVVVGIVLVLGLASPAHAAGFFQSAWGEDVVANNASVGTEVCTVSTDCKEGVQDGVGGAFRAPSTVASDGAGNVYVLEEAGSRVQRFNSSGVFQRMWGKDVIRSGAATDTGTGFEICTVAADCQQGSQGTLGGELSHPKGIAVDPAGNVYVADTVNNRIQEYTSAGAFVRAFRPQR